jgi:signal transduction histidine kinase
MADLATPTAPKEELSLETQEPALEPEISHSFSPPPAVAADHPPEEKYHYLTQYGTQILCILDAEEGCVYLSQNFEPLMGLEPGKYSGNAFYSLVHHDFRQRLKALVTDNTETPSTPFRCKLQHADKKWYWHQFNIHPRQDVPHQRVCIVEDINDSMITQNTLQKAKLEAELALRTRSEFLANMSHDLRTPLNAVIGFAQIIESEILGKISNQQYIEYAKHIQESGYDLLAKIEDMLEIANIDAGRVSLARSEVYVSDILHQVAETQKHHAQAAHIKIEIAPVPADILLYIDRLKLQHILGHLTANAIKFSREGGVITLSCEKGGNGDIYLTVRDNGLGISDVRLNAIISSLQEDNCWTMDNNRNIGLGLALTREFVALHEGRVAIGSAPGEGTTVKITLPKDCVRSTLVNTSDYLKQAMS